MYHNQCSCKLASQGTVLWAPHTCRESSGVYIEHRYSFVVITVIARSMRLESHGIMFPVSRQSTVQDFVQIARRTSHPWIQQALLVLKGVCYIRKATCLYCFKLEVIFHESSPSLYIGGCLYHRVHDWSSHCIFISSTIDLCLVV